MKNIKQNPEEKKLGLHPRNKHAHRYDFPALIISSPELKNYVSKNKFNDESIDFANPLAVKALNRALLAHFYNIKSWDVPKDYLCPPIPGRADYIHLMADLLASKNNKYIPRGNKIRMLDIGVGANCVYPIIATAEYGWSVLGSDIDADALTNATKIISENSLQEQVLLKLQSDSALIFKGIIEEKDFFDLTISNPPFHSSAEEASSSSLKKNKNLGRNKPKNNSPVLNFGGVNHELWCEGGEVSFITRMIKESVEYKTNCFWFSTLVSKATSLPAIYEELKKINVVDFKTIDMAQGHKKSRIVAWTFLNPGEQHIWSKGLK